LFLPYAFLNKDAPFLN